MGTEREDHSQQLEKVIRYYDRAQKFYEVAWNSKGLHYGLWTDGVHHRAEAIEKENEVLANWAGIKSGETVLDAGCGVGGSGIWLAKNRGVEVFGINIARNQLTHSRKLAERNSVNKHLGFTEADYHYLPFASGSMDVFWSLESIEHSDDPELMIQEAYRILKPGGRAVIAGTFKGKKEPTDEQVRQLNVGFRAAGAFNDFRSANEIAGVLAESGFGEIYCNNVTSGIMESAREMERMCEWGLPFARLGNGVNLVSQIMVDNTEWGTHQKELFEAGVTSYNMLLAKKD